MSRKFIILGAGVALISVAAAGVTIVGANKTSVAVTAVPAPAAPQAAQLGIPSPIPQAKPSFFEQAMRPLPAAPPQVNAAPAIPASARQHAAETVTVTAQRQTQVALVDVDRIGRGNNLTI